MRLPEYNNRIVHRRFVFFNITIGRKKKKKQTITNRIGTMKYLKNVPLVYNIMT